MTLVHPNPQDFVPNFRRFCDPALALMERAIVAANATARWEIHDLLSEWNGEQTRDRLRTRAARLASSPLAEDQLLSVVLKKASRELNQGHTLPAASIPFEPPPPMSISPCDGIDTADWVEASPDDEAWVGDLIGRRRALGLSSRALTNRLAEDADLQAFLCTDWRIPATQSLRRRMAALVPIIMRRGRELNSSWWRRYFQRLSDWNPTVRSDPANDSQRPAIMLCASDHESLLRLASLALLCEPRAASPLLREIERATVVSDADLPKQVVRLGAHIGYSDRLSGQFHKVQLVGHVSTADAGLVSVLNPVGSALIGLAIGETIHWTDYFGLETVVTVRTVEHDTLP